MRSVLNEASIFDIVAAYTNPENIKTAANNKINGAKSQDFLKGSISRYTKNLIMSFPMLVDNTISIETAQMISKANEKNIVSMFQMMFASMSLQGDNGVEILSRFHRNLDSASIDDIIDALDAVVKESYTDKAELAHAITEMCSKLKQGSKSFPVSSFSERSLNDYQVRNMYGNMVVMEANKNPNPFLTQTDDDKYEEDKRITDRNERAAGKDAQYLYDTEDNDRARAKDQRERDKEEREKQKDANEERRKEAKEERDKLASLKKNALDDSNLLNKQILDSDFKKANELQPTTLTITFNNTEEGRVVERKTFIAGIKSRMVGVDSVDIVERLVAKNKTKLSFANLIKATTGEVKFFRDFILCTKQNKLNAKNAAKKGASAQMWNLLEKRSTANNFNKLRRKGNDAAAITTLVINQATANYMKAAYNFDISQVKNAKLIVDAYNLLGLVIADDANEIAKFFYDGNNSFDMYAYSGLSREIAERNAKLNLINAR